MGKSTISMVIFHSYVSLPEGNHVGPLDELPQFDVPSLQLLGLSC